MRLSGDCRFYFFLGWLAWWMAGWSLVLAQFLLRSGSQFGFYGVEAWAAMLIPMAAIGSADVLTMRLYEGVWRSFNRESLGPVVLEREAVDRLRDDLRRSILLRWLAPPPSRSVAAQLLTAAWWLPALAAPDGTPWHERYREGLIDVACMTLLPLAVVVLLYAPRPWNMPAALLLAGVALLPLGYSLLRLAARRQAILDYFEAWKSPEPLA